MRTYKIFYRFLQMAEYDRECVLAEEELTVARKRHSELTKQLSIQDSCMGDITRMVNGIFALSI